MTRSVIVSAVLTPFGRLGGGLKDYEAPQLGAHVIRAAMEKVGLEPHEVEYVIMGEVLQAGVGQAPARQAAIAAGLPKELPADTINKVCASSIRAVQIADAMIRSGVPCARSTRGALPTRSPRSTVSRSTKGRGGTPRSRSSPR